MEMVGKDETNDCGSSVDQQNRITSQCEVAEFKSNPPERYFAYVKEADGICPAHITTWMGDLLGTARLGTPYKVWGFGGNSSTRQSIRVKAINGREYYGTYYRSSGDYCRLRVVKVKAKKSLASPTAPSVG